MKEEKYGGKIGRGKYTQTHTHTQAGLLSLRISFQIGLFDTRLESRYLG